MPIQRENSETHSNNQRRINLQQVYLSQKKGKITKINLTKKYLRNPTKHQLATRKECMDTFNKQRNPKSAQTSPKSQLCTDKNRVDHMKTKITNRKPHKMHTFLKQKKSEHRNAYILPKSKIVQVNTKITKKIVVKSESFEHINILINPK